MKSHLNKLYGTELTLNSASVFTYDVVAASGGRPAMNAEVFHEGSVNRDVHVAVNEDATVNHPYLTDSTPLRSIKFRDTPISKFTFIRSSTGSGNPKIVIFAW